MRHTNIGGGGGDEILLWVHNNNIYQYVLKCNILFVYLQIINKINQLSYKMFNDLPRGDQKCKECGLKANTLLFKIHKNFF